MKSKHLSPAVPPCVSSQSGATPEKQIQLSLGGLLRPWWTGVSVGVLALGLGVSGAKAEVTVSSGSVGASGVSTNALQTGALGTTTPGVLTLAPVTVSKNTSAYVNFTNVVVLDVSYCKVTLEGSHTDISQNMVVYGSGITGKAVVSNVNLTTATVNGVAGVAVTEVTLIGTVAIPGAAASTSLTFKAPSQASVAAETQIADLQGAETWITSGGDTFRVSPGKIFNSNPSNAATANNPLKLSISAGSFAGDIQNNAGGGSTSTISVEKVSSGLLTLSGANTYSGGTKLSAGELRVASATALGTGAVTASGGVLSGVNGIAINNQVSIDDGNAAVGTVSLALASATDSRATQVNRTAGAATTPVDISTAKSFLLRGNVALADNLAAEVIGSVRIAGIISDPVGADLGITKSGVGALSLSGANTYTGPTVLNNGELRAESSSVVGSGPFGLGPNAVITLNGGALSGGNNNAAGTAGAPAAATTITVGNNLVFGAAGASSTLNVQLGRGATYDDAENILKDGDTLILAGNATLNQTSAIAVPKGGDVTMTGVVSGVGGIVKTGDGALALANPLHATTPNTFSGGVTLREGKVSVQDKTDLGTGKVVFAGGNTDDNSSKGVLELAAGGVAASLDVSAAIASIGAGQEAKIIAPAAGVTFASGLTGAGGLRLEGGKLQVADSNSYTGATIVDGNTSTLRLNKANSIASSSEVIIKGTLDGTADGFAFSSSQPVEVTSAGNMNIKVAATAAQTFSNANLTVNARSNNKDLGAAVKVTSVGNTPTVNVGVVNVKINTLSNTVADSYVVGEVHPTGTVGPVSVADFISAYQGAVTTAAVTVTTDAGSTITSGRPIYKLTWSKDGDNLGFYRQSYAVFGRGTNGANFGAYLDKQNLDAVNGNGTSTLAVPTALRYVDRNFTESSQFTQFLNELSAQPFADMARSGFERTQAVLGGVEDRIASLATSATGEGVSRKFGYKQAAPIAKPAPAKAAPSDSWDAWLSVYGRDGSDKASVADGASKLINTEGGVQFGVERQMGNLTIGLTGATGWGESNFNTPNTHISTDSWHIGMYAVAPLESLILDASVLYGLSTNDSVRTPRLNALLGTTGADASYHGKFDSRDLSISVGLAYNMLSPDSAFQAAPVLRLTYLNYSQTAFSEFEAQGNNGFGYNVNAMSADKFLTKLGYRVSYNTKIGASTDFGADLGAYWQHDWNTGASSVNAAMAGGVAGTSYQAVGRKSSSDLAIVNGGLQLTFDDRYLIRGSGAVEFGGKRDNLTGSVTFGIKF